MTAMRILTVRQPWAWAIIHGGKDVENRVRNIAGDYRGPVAIHAAQATDYEGWNRAGAGALVDENPAGKIATDAARGHIIGVVDLVGIHHPRDRWGCPPSPGDLLPMCSEWAEAGAYHLVLRDPRPLVEPTPFRGALGLRRLDDDLVARIEAAIA